MIQLDLIIVVGFFFLVILELEEGGRLAYR